VPVAEDDGIAGCNEVRGQRLGDLACAEETDGPSGVVHGMRTRCCAGLPVAQPPMSTWRMSNALNRIVLARTSTGSAASAPSITNGPLSARRPHLLLRNGSGGRRRAFEDHVS
jgi:hypothetical protein